MKGSKPMVSIAPWIIRDKTGNIFNKGYIYDTTLMAESEEELKSLLMKVKEESEKVGLKLDRKSVV